MVKKYFHQSEINILELSEEIKRIRKYGIHNLGQTFVNSID